MESTRPCKSRVRHPSMEMALASLAELRKRDHPSRAKRFGAYRCALCDGFHTGHLTVRRYKRLLTLAKRPAR